MFDVSVFIDEVIVKKGEDFVNTKDRVLCIAMLYVFSDTETRNNIFESIKKSEITVIDPTKYFGNIDIDQAYEDIKKFGVTEYRIIDGVEVDRIPSDVLNRSIVTALKFKSIVHKKMFMNIFKIAKRYGVIQ